MHEVNQFDLQVAKNIDKWLHKLSASRVYPLGEGDKNVVKSICGNQEADYK